MSIAGMIIAAGDRVVYRKWRDDWQEGGRPFIGTVKDTYTDKHGERQAYVHWPSLGIYTTGRAWQFAKEQA